MIAYLLDKDEWLCRQGHPLRLLPARLLAYCKLSVRVHDDSKPYEGSDRRRQGQRVEEYNVTRKRTDKELAEAAIELKEAKR